MKLSPYTVAKNCTDLADIQVGIKEVTQYLIKAHWDIKLPKTLAYIRLAKLYKKKEVINK
jgi:hypothetical protein